MTHLHNIKTIQETSEAIVEYCSRCKEKFYFRKDRRGRVDNEEWKKVHKKEILQPWGEDEKDFLKEFKYKTYDKEEGGNDPD